jgi:hypothetical protein
MAIAAALQPNRLRHLDISDNDLSFECRDWLRIMFGDRVYLDARKEIKMT